jgi:hypothetical protein
MKEKAAALTGEILDSTEGLRLKLEIRFAPHQQEMNPV